jgi:hypothetical protein
MMVVVVSRYEVVTRPPDFCRDTLMLREKGGKEGSTYLDERCGPLERREVKGDIDYVSAEERFGEYGHVLASVA